MVFTPSKRMCNAMLQALLGREDLVERWWSSPNRGFDGKTPDEVWETRPMEVFSYLNGHCSGDYH
jgi:hypothetical protein